MSLTQRIHDNTGPRNNGGFFCHLYEAMKQAILFNTISTWLQAYTLCPDSYGDAYRQAGKWYAMNGESIAIRPCAEQPDTV